MSGTMQCMASHVSSARIFRRLGVPVLRQMPLESRVHPGGLRHHIPLYRQGLVSKVALRASDNGQGEGPETGASANPTNESTPAPPAGAPAARSTPADAEDASAAVQSVVEDAVVQAEAAAQESAASVAVPAPSGAVPSALQFARDNPLGGYSVAALLGFLGITFVVATVRVALRAFSPQAKRGRTVNKNKLVVDELAKHLPSNRAGLTGPVIAGLRLRTGFTPVEIFRKYLWFLLRERKFDTDAVADVVALKGALGLTDEQVAGALNERAKRVYDKYGNVMLDTTGMSAAAVERKAAARGLFSKMLYLVECEELLAPEAAAGVSLREIFGATEDDTAKLRIPSLFEIDLESALGLPSAAAGDE